MINYADYQFYKETYKGSLSDSLFNSLIPKASREIDKVVNRELQEADINNKVKFVACELVDFLNNNSDKGALSSVSIDGVSKTYSSRQEYRQSRAEILNGLPLDLIRFL